MSEAAFNNVGDFNKNDFFSVKTQDGVEFVLIKKEVYEGLIRSGMPHVSSSASLNLSLKDYIGERVSLEDLPF